MKTRKSRNIWVVTLLTPNQHHTANLSQHNKARKTNKRNIDSTSRNKTCLFADDLISYIEIFKLYETKLL